MYDHYSLTCFSSVASSMSARREIECVPGDCRGESVMTTGGGVKSVASVEGLAIDSTSDSSSFIFRERDKISVLTCRRTVETAITC